MERMLATLLMLEAVDLEVQVPEGAQHVEYESDAWINDINAYIFYWVNVVTSLQDTAIFDEPDVLVPAVLRCLSALDRWLTAHPAPPTVPVASFAVVLPVHRLCALLLHQFYIRFGALPPPPSQDLYVRMALRPMDIFRAKSEVRVGLYRRNGFMLEQHLHFYVEEASKPFNIELDIFLLQVALIHAGPGEQPGQEERRGRRKRRRSRRMRRRGRRRR